MNDFLNERRATFAAAEADFDAKETAAAAARRELYRAGEALTQALLDHVRPLYTEGQILITRSHGEIKIDSITVPVHAKTEVRAVFRTRIKSGAWGKTVTTSSGVIWDFENNRWRTGVVYGGRIDWDDAADQLPPTATVA